MRKYETKYFGDFIVGKNEEEIVIETKTNITGKEQEISIMIKNIKKIFKKIEICVKILDDYSKLYELGKSIIENEYGKDNEMKRFFQEIFGKYKEELLDKAFGVKNMEKIKIEEVVKNIDAPSIMFDIKDEKLKIELLYTFVDEMNELMAIEIDEKYEMKRIRYYEV